MIVPPVQGSVVIPAEGKRGANASNLSSVAEFPLQWQHHHHHACRRRRVTSWTRFGRNGGGVLRGNVRAPERVSG
jgi:hypothetical protein